MTPHRRGVIFEKDGYWGVAELAKHRTVNPGIAGSTPAAPACGMFWRGAREAQGSGLLNRDARKASVGSNPTLSAPRGPVSERLKEHDWKSCGVNSPRGFESHPVRSMQETFGTWLSPVEHSLRERGVGGSNPPVPTMRRRLRRRRISEDGRSGRVPRGAFLRRSLGSASPNW
jgi:hypothetical protein